TSRWIRFFFQAEDGIRDDLVTGVQTCALPISQQQTGDDRKIEVDIAAVDRNVAGQPAEKWDSQTEEEDQPDQHDEATDDDEQLPDLGHEFMVQAQCDSLPLVGRDREGFPRTRSSRSLARSAPAAGPRS